MIRLFKIVNPVEYKDFENYLFSFPDKITFDFPNDKLTIETVDYRISTIINLDDDTSGVGVMSTNENKDVVFDSITIDADTVINAIPDKTKTIAFHNKGETTVIIDNDNIVEPNESVIYGGTANTIITNNFNIEFSGSGTKNLIIITELYL